MGSLTTEKRRDTIDTVTDLRLQALCSQMLVLLENISLAEDVGCHATACAASALDALMTHSGDIIQRRPSSILNASCHADLRSTVR